MKIDLHTHSIGSPDGGLCTDDYRRMLQSGKLDFVAITDHGTIVTAQRIQSELGRLGERIIIGEEIKTTDGELVGLYLSESICDGMTLEETVAAIRDQNGVVYVPHPFESVRSGVSYEGLQSILSEVDVIEVYNGRAYFQDYSVRATLVAKENHKAMSAASDAHGWIGWGKTLTIVAHEPTRDSLLALLQDGQLQTQRVGLGILYPKLNRLKKKFAQ